MKRMMVGIALVTILLMSGCITEHKEYEYKTIDEYRCIAQIKLATENASEFCEENPNGRWVGFACDKQVIVYCKDWR